MGRRRYLLLDRDGTLIEERHYLSDPDGVVLIPGAAAALAQLQVAGWGIAVITNQAGIGRGFFKLADAEAVNRRVAELLSVNGVELDGFFICPHAPDAECHCRKPEPGLVEQASRELDFDPKQAVFVGDKAADIELAKRVGATSVLVRTGYGALEESNPDVRPDCVINSLADLATCLESSSR